MISCRTRNTLLNVIEWLLGVDILFIFVSSIFGIFCVRVGEVAYSFVKKITRVTRNKKGKKRETKLSKK